jgi:hypothetical protein
VLVYLGRIPLALWIGARVLGSRARTGRGGIILSFLVGGVILLVVAFIPLLGGLAMAVATILGLGAFVLRLQAIRAKQPA